MVTTIPSLRVAFCVPNETGASSESSSGWLDMKTNQGFRGCVQSVVCHLTSQQVTVKRYLLSTYNRPKKGLKCTELTALEKAAADSTHMIQSLPKRL